MKTKQQQIILSVLCLYKGRIDGIDGPKTQTALSEFCELEECDYNTVTETLGKKIEALALGSYSDKDGLAQAVRELCSALYVANPKIWAYLMATAEHETANSFYPVEEAFYIRDERARKRYLESKKYYPYYGRGLVQLTWDFNYKKYSEILSIDLVNQPEIVLEPSISLFIFVHGMCSGAFTGRSIGRYINSHGTDYINARRVVNGTDKALDIAKLAAKWEQYYAKNS